MRYGLMTVAALTFLAGPTFADDVVVSPIIPLPGVVVEHHDTVVHDGDVRANDGCTTKTVKKENAEGDSVTKTKSDC